MKKTKLLYLIPFLTLQLLSYSQKIEVKLIINDSTENKIKTISNQLNSLNEAQDFYTNQLDLLYKKGFLSLSIDSTVSKKTKKTYYLKLNTKIDSIAIEIPHQYQKYITDKDQQNLYIPFEEWENTQKQILQRLTEEGYDFSKVNYTPISLEGKFLQAKLQLEVNELKKINDLIIRGYDEFPEGFKKHYIRIKKGEIYTEKKLKRRTKVIQNIDFVNEIKNPEVQFTKDSVNVFLYLEKNKINSFDGFIGFSNEEESSGLNLNGYLDVLLKNNLNLGETLIIRYKNDGQDQQIFKSRLSLPFVFKSRFTPEVGIELFRQDSTFSRSTQELRLGYHINHQWNIFADLEVVSSSNLLNNEVEPITTSPINDYNTTFYGVTTRFRNRKKNIGEIVNQDFSELRVLQGNRESTNNNLQQLKVEFYGETLQKILNKTYLNLASTIHILDSDNYLDNELFRLGGLRSMRGFDENSLIASSFYSLQTEIRYFLSGDLYANTVLDYGYYQNKLINLEENLFSFGFGIGLNTKGGLLRLIFANGRSSQQEFNFQNTQVHLSLNTFF